MDKWQTLQIGHVVDEAVSSFGASPRNFSVQRVNYQGQSGCGGAYPCDFTRFNIVFVPDCVDITPTGFMAHGSDGRPSAYQDKCDCGHGHCVPSCTAPPDRSQEGWCTNTCMGGCQHGAGSKCICHGNWGPAPWPPPLPPNWVPAAIPNKVATCTACVEDWHGPDCNLKFPPPSPAPPVSPPPSPPPPPLPPASPPDVALVPSSVPVGDHVTIRLNGAAATDGSTVVFLHASNDACMGAMTGSLYNGGVVIDGCVSVLMMQIGLYKMCISTRPTPLHDTDFLVSTGVFLHATFASPPAESPPPSFASTSIAPDSQYEVPGLSTSNTVVIIVSVVLALALIGTCIVRRTRISQRFVAGILLSDQDQGIDSVMMGHAVLPVAAVPVVQPVSQSLPTRYPEPLSVPETSLKQVS